MWICQIPILCIHIPKSDICHNVEMIKIKQFRLVCISYLQAPDVQFQFPGLNLEHEF